MPQNCIFGHEMHLYVVFIAYYSERALKKHSFGTKPAKKVSGEGAWGCGLVCWEKNGIFPKIQNGGLPFKVDKMAHKGMGMSLKETNYFILISYSLKVFFAKSLPYRDPPSMLSLSRTSLTSFALREERFVKKKKNNQSTTPRPNNSITAHLLIC